MKVWIPEHILNLCIEEATKAFPFESGGLFLGWWTENKDVVVSEFVGPGEKAVRGKYFFTPDHKWQNRKIAQLYKASKQPLEYLGDWHSHPNQKEISASWADWKSLNVISKNPESRCSKPLMMIFGGGPKKWNQKLWIGVPSRGCLGLKTIKMTEINFLVF